MTCPMSDLPPDQCAHCRGHDDTAIPHPHEVARVRRHPGDPVDVAAQFTARYQGRCHACDGLIVPGRPIGRTTDGDYVCERCLP